MLSETERQQLREEIRSAVSAQDASGVLERARKLVRGAANAARAAQDAGFCASAIERLGDALVARGEARRVKTFLVRSVTVEPVVPFLKLETALNGLLLDVEVGGYGSYVDDLMNADGALARSAPQLVVVVLELEDIAGGLADACITGPEPVVEEMVDAAARRLEQMLRAARGVSSARMVVQGFVVPDHTALGDVGDANLNFSLPRAVERLNREVARRCAAAGSIADCVFFEVDRVAAREGRARWRDHRMFLSTRLAVAADNFGAYAQGVARAAAALFRPARKVLCTDLDNTLWGGVLGEEGPQGIATGGAFPGNCYLEYQRYLKQLSSRGILLAVASKNNRADVDEAFALRAADLGVTLDDFVAKRINWNDKTQSLREMAAELSLGLDSFVFVDDNPVECEAIRQALPEVTVIGAPIAEPWKMVEMLAGQALFDSVAVTEDDLNRKQEYRAQAQRAELAETAASRDEFLASLGIVCTFVPATAAPLSRSVQLLAKTNQFNLTTRRHSAAEVERFAESPRGAAVAVRVRDRFGDAGVVGLAMGEMDGDDFRVDTFLLSCRVIGRGIETALLAEMAAYARRYGANRLIGEFVPTKKNSLCASFYPDHGFARAADDAAGETVFYEFDLREPMDAPAWLTIERNEEYELATDASIAT